MAKKHFRAFQNVVLTLYLASFYQIMTCKKTSRVQDCAVRSPVPPKVERDNIGLFCLEFSLLSD